MTNDETLITDFLNGNEKAYEHLIDKYKGPVFRMVMGFLGNYHDTEECAQDIFVKLYFQLKNFKRKSAFSTWLYTIVQNAAKNYRLKRSLKQAISLEWLNEIGQVDFPSKEISQEIKAEKQESIFELNQVLDKLSFKLRQILILREINELSYEEIATILDCSLGTVKSRISRAKDKLQELYRKEFTHEYSPSF